MRTIIVAMLVASGTLIALPALAQQQTAPNPQQVQEEADKGAKTRQSGESGYVGEQEKPGASTHPPGRTDTAPPTTGSATGTSTGAAGSAERPR
ncbi:hypothetical protein [Bradyrhizobium sp. Leo170]|uniref:hypothetical protein n=1 Tax=Bradyrhizobium sp. Leo170 TaxID=1571199 RepID=UPI00102EA80B|nr:hypothetical protein [Bradyrhizobium sp. Leo170]TAI62476.1 hypothetical protein CWO89_29445 [Bradyrhizobium sp. Leo170]